MSDTRFKKGQKPGPGRPKGVTNQITQDVKEMVVSALQKTGGVEYLVERANDPKTASAFLTLVGKVLPLTVNGHLTVGLAAELAKLNEPK